MITEQGWDHILKTCFTALKPGVWYLKCEDDTYIIYWEKDGSILHTDHKPKTEIAEFKSRFREDA